MSQSTIRLIEQTPAIAASLDSAGSYRVLSGAELAPELLEHCVAVVRQFLDYAARAGSTAPWTGYLVVCEATNRTIGCCGYKGLPDADSRIEIAYHTFEPYEGKGYAGAMARMLTAIAEDHGAEPFAHTLPERNASCRILERCGYALTGPVEDPEDGTIWLWERAEGDRR